MSVIGRWNISGRRILAYHCSMCMFNQLQTYINYMCKYVAYTFPTWYYMYSITTSNPEISTDSHCIVVRTLSAFWPGVAARVNPIREGIHCRCVYSYTVHIVYTYNNYVYASIPTRITCTPFLEM